MGFIDDELENSKAHPEHPIQLTSVNKPFYCDGCEEPGIGDCYICKDPSGRCRKVFHEECGRADEITSHPFSKGCHFTLFRPKKVVDGPLIHRICDACCTEVKGFYYACYKHEKPHGHFIHPSCIKLGNRLQLPGIDLELKGTVQGKCGLCGHKRVFDKMKGWSYVSTCGSQDLCLHIKCVKTIFLDEWKKMKFGGSGGGGYQSIASSSTSTPAAARIMIVGGPIGNTTSNSGQGQALVLYGGGKPSFSIKKYATKVINLLKLAVPVIISSMFGTSVHLMPALSFKPLLLSNQKTHHPPSQTVRIPTVIYIFSAGLIPSSIIPIQACVLNVFCPAGLIPFLYYTMCLLCLHYSEPI